MRKLKRALYLWLGKFTVSWSMRFCALSNDINTIPVSRDNFARYLESGRFEKNNTRMQHVHFAYTIRSASQKIIKFAVKSHAKRRRWDPNENFYREIAIKQFRNWYLKKHRCLLLLDSNKKKLRIDIENHWVWFTVEFYLYAIISKTYEEAQRPRRFWRLCDFWQRSNNFVRKFYTS